MTHLKLTNISKEYGGTTVVQDFNLDVEQGEFVSFLGPSGCGKTTTLRMVAGFETPTRGTITINNQDITNIPPNQRNVGMIFQAYALFPNMTVAQNIGFGMQIHKESKSAIKQRVEEMLALINLEKHANKYPFQLSGGQQQRVALARALANHPQLLLLDEPLSALDAKIRVQLRSEIRAIQKKMGSPRSLSPTTRKKHYPSQTELLLCMKAGLNRLELPSRSTTSRRPPLSPILLER
jgi:putative spermidine/putrescine transport system ATP-binding protein